MKYFSFIVLISLSLSACVTPIEVHKSKSTDTNNSVDISKKKWEKTIPFFLFGLIGSRSTKQIKAWEKCNTDWYSIKISKPFTHVLVSLFTLGIYTPQKIIIICKEISLLEDLETGEPEETKF